MHHRYASDAPRRRQAGSIVSLGSVRTVSSREVYRNAWMSIREDEVVLQDGTSGLYGVVDKPDFALVIPREDDGSLWLVEQYRYPVRRRAWEFPQGSWGQTSTGSQVELAAAELREETGLHAQTLRHLGHLHEAYGFCSQGFDVYLGEGLRRGSVDRETSEQDMQHRRVGDADFRRMVRQGLIVDGATVAAYSLMRLHEG